MQICTKKNTQIKKILIISLLFLLSFLSILLSIGVGSVSISPVDVIKSLFSDEESMYRIIVFDLRLPRTLVAGLVGICLSLSGCILQGVMRNKLASPSTIGVTSGASFVGYLTLVVFPSYYEFLPIGSVIGAFFTTMLIYSISYTKGVSPVRMILSGMAISALFGAFNDMIKTFFADRIENVQGFLVGGLTGTTWTEFYMILPFAVLGVVSCLIFASKLNVLMLGDETANSLGLNVEKFRFLLIVISSLLSGGAVAVSGMISFVGLIVPHIARLLVGSDYRYLFVTTILMSVTFMTFCDSLGRILMSPSEIPVSIVISFIGAPFFLYLLRTREE